MKRIRIIGVILFICFLAVPAAAGIYKWTDEAGVVHYSNTPRALPETGVDERGEVKSKVIKKVVVPEQSEITLKPKVKKRKAKIKPKIKPKLKYIFQHWSVSQNAGVLSVSGRVSGGAACDNLKITVFVKDAKGSIRNIVCNVKVGSYGSAIVSGNTPAFFESSGWKVFEVFTSCLD